MKSLSTAALIFLATGAFAQSADWYAARFGFNAPSPDLFAYQGPTDYKNLVYNTGRSAVRWSGTNAPMLGANVLPVATGSAWNDPSNRLWGELYDTTDLLPKGTWLRVTGNLLNHFPNPYNPGGQANAERNLQAIVGRLMFRGNDLSNGLNILWNVTPGVYPTALPSDGWSTISTDAGGKRLAAPVPMGDPARRDWWRPADAYFPYLKTHVQTFVYDVNNAAASIARQRTGSGTMTENFISRMAFQLGNEPAAGHPGGSIDGAVGSWTGLGKVLDQTMAAVDYKPSAASMLANQVPASFGSNPLTMPAYSMFSEGVDTYRINYTMGQLRNIQWGGATAAGLTELSTSMNEMGRWQSYCSRRALHFCSPTYRWKLNPMSAYASTKPDDLLTSGPQDPSIGRWETPAEYAKRWVDELEKQVNIVVNIPMPGKAKIVDITECYFTGGQSSAVANLTPGTKYANGSTIDFTALSFEQIRTMARNNGVNNGVLSPLQQIPASRESLLAAIRTELYTRDTNKTLNPYLGRIYWWGGYYVDPRTETGLIADDKNNVVGYNAWGDFRLTQSEIKALWGTN